MKQILPKASRAFSSKAGNAANRLAGTILLFIAILLANATNAQQAVAGIITDYNGFWKTKNGAYNTLKPVNSHNLLSFTYNNTQYSTGVNDAVLTANGESFAAGDFWALPVESIAGAVTSNTKVGVGELFDGVHNGTGTVPANDLKSYLNDGIRGLDIGTCVANLPAGDLTFFVNNINPANIGDGIPDIVVTQVADPSGSFDRYSFIDNNSNVVGFNRDIIFTNIPAVGTWTADFWDATKNPMTLNSGFVNTDRAIRLWAADLSEFGITAANYSTVRKFRIRLSGDSDVAFVAYNRKTISITAVLPLHLNDFTAKSTGNKTVLSWSTSSEVNTHHFIVEKKNNNGSFTSIDSVTATGSSTAVNYYSATDNQMASGSNYYRLRMVDNDGGFSYSKTILVSSSSSTKLSLNIFPNPATSDITITVPAAVSPSLGIYSTSGLLVNQVSLGANTAQVSVNISTLPKGVYYIIWNSGAEKLSQSFVVR